MGHDVRCPGCHREEHWTRSGGGWAAEVRVAGGARRLGDDAERARGRVLVRAAREHLRVAGVCSACGQFLLTDADGPDAGPVEVALGQGALALRDGALRLAEAPLSPDQAEGLLVVPQTWRRFVPGAGELARLPFFVVLVPIAVGWVLAGIFVVSFVAAMVEWAPTPVR